MKAVAREWVKKAEGDFNTMQREYRARKSPNYDSACFHAQQCVEKYLKGCLQELSIRFPRTHDLVALLKLLLPTQPLWRSFESMFKQLNSAAVEVRYPGRSATKQMAREAISICRSFRTVARASLGLP